MKLAIVSPCYNESEVLPASVERLTGLMNDLIAKQKISPDSFILFVNDGSHDNTWELITHFFITNPYVRGINLSANMGHQQAIMAGMMAIKDRCDAVITIDADLQDDLAAIEEMIDRHAEGYDIVYGVKVSRSADPFFKRHAALTFYKLQQCLGVKSVYNHADFRLLSRCALEQLSHFKERNLYLRGIIPLLGYKTTTVDDVISPRVAGQSKYTLCKMLSLAVDGITSFSTKPITLIIGAGFFFMFVSLLMTVYVVYSYCKHLTVPGWASLMLSMWLIGSVILFAIGIVGQYIGKIYIEVKNRPLYHIDTFLYDEGDEKKNQK